MVQWTREVDEGVKSKTECMFLNGVSRGSVLMQDHELREVSKFEFKYLESMLETGGGVEAEISHPSGWNDSMKMAGVMFDN